MALPCSAPPSLIVCTALASPRWPRFAELMTYPVDDLPTMIKRPPGGTRSGPEVSRSASPPSRFAWFAGVNQSARARLEFSLMKLSLKFETPSHVPLLVPKYMLPDESTAGPCPDIHKLSPLPVGDVLKTASFARLVGS